MEMHTTGDTQGAESTPSTTRIAHIAHVESTAVQGTMAVPRVLDTTRTGMHLQRETERVQAVLARYGRDTVDPSDPKGRSYYDTARRTIPGLLLAIDCPDGTTLTGMDYTFHNGRYPLDIDKHLPPELLPVVRDALAEWPHTTLVSRSVSHEALWAIARGPRAISEHEFKHYQQALIDMLPDSVRPHVAGGQSDLNTPRSWAWDPEAVTGPDIEAILSPPPDPDEPDPGSNGEVPPQDGTAAARERERVRSALEYVPLDDDSDRWFQVAMALIHEDVKQGEEQFRGPDIFTEWTSRAARDGSTKPSAALAMYKQWALESAERENQTHRWTLLAVYALARENGWKPPRRRTGESRHRTGPAAGNAAPESPGETADQRSRVSVGNDLHTETQTVVRDIVAWNTPPRYFSNVDGSSVVEVVAGEIRHVSRERIAAIMSAACAFVKRYARGNESPCYPPPQLIGAVAAELARHLPVLHGIKRIPFYCEGAIVALTDPGYHAESGYWCDQGEGWDIDLDIDETIRRIDDLIGEFPYAEPADRATAYGLLIGQVLKSEWVSPILEISKPSSQTGASKLSQTIACLADGREPAILTASVRVDETDKRIISKLRDGPQGLLIDNLSRTFDSDVVASGMTSTYIGGRLLGGNDSAAVLTKALQIYITGNNGSLSRDMVNRAISVRLDARVEHPEERTGFRHVLPADALANRKHFFSSALSLVKRWIDAGEPGPPAGFTALSSFGPWMNAVAGILHVAGIDGFNENRETFRERADRSGNEDLHFVSMWLASESTTGCRPGDLLVLGEAAFTLQGNGDSARAQSLGHRLARLEDRVFTMPEVTVTVRRHHIRTGTTYSLVKLDDVTM